MRILFWDGVATQYVHETMSVQAMLEFMRHYAGDRSGWITMLSGPDGWTELPLRDYL